MKETMRIRSGHGERNTVLINYVQTDTETQSARWKSKWGGDRGGSGEVETESKNPNLFNNSGIQVRRLVHSSLKGECTKKNPSQTTELFDNP